MAKYHDFLLQKEINAIYKIWYAKYTVKRPTQTWSFSFDWKLGDGCIHLSDFRELFLFPLQNGLDACSKMDADKIMDEVIQHLAAFEKAAPEQLTHIMIDTMRVMIHYISLKYLAVINFNPDKFMELIRIYDNDEKMRIK